MATTQMSLKLVVDKKMNRVVFAECGSDFVDVLLSFLTMPIGTIIRLTRKESKIGGMSTLYESAEDLDVNLLQTEACKKMLLYPKNAAEEHCKNLKVNIDNTEPTKYYACSLDCCAIKHGLLSTFYNAQCGCGQSMNTQAIYNQQLNNVACSRDGVFVKGNMRYIIRDDLQVFPISTKATFTLLNDLGISDASVLEERNVNVGPAEVLHLLNRLLQSKTPLKDVFLRDQDMIGCSNHDFIVDALHRKDLDQPQKVKGNGGNNSKKISVKLSVNKSNNKVVYAEGGEEFADLLFSFLAFPLGFLPKFFGGDSGIRCLDNLYRSVQVLKDFLKSDECKGLLIDPNLATFFICNNQPLQVKEQIPWQAAIECSYKRKELRGGRIKIKDSGTEFCSHGYHNRLLSIINPKYPNAVKELGGAFFAGPALFMVTDELNVKQLSTMSAIFLLTKLNISMSDIEEHVVSIGEKEAASLLLASLISKTVLTDVFYPKKPKHSGKKSYNKVKIEV